MAVDCNNLDEALDVARSIAAKSIGGATKSAP